MMNPSNNLEWYVSLILFWVKELSIISLVGLAIRLTWRIGWGARGAWDKAEAFFFRIEKHMTIMEGFAETLTTNHLHHIEKALDAIAGTEPAEPVKEINDAN
jgi:hypothetical protein